MGSLRFIQFCRRAIRFLRYKFHPEITLLFAPIKLILSSGIRRTRQEIRCLKAISRIDFVSLYEFLNDLLW